MMKRTSCFSLALVCLLTPSALAVRSTLDAKDQLVVMRLSGPILENPSPADFSFDPEPKRSMHTLLEKLDQAGEDESVKGLVLILDEPFIGWAQIQEIQQAMVRFRASEKPVHCYFESASLGAYLVACAADEVIMVPTGTLMLTGLRAESIYFKGLLDHLNLEADVIPIGNYKAAGEPFTRTGPSEEAKKNIEWLVDDLYEQMVHTIAEQRGLEPDAVRVAIDDGPHRTAEALEHKLVDRAAYMEDYLTSLKENFGEEIVLNTRYGLDKKKKVDFSNPFNFFKMLGEAMAEKEAPQKDSIALIHVDGMIVTGKTEQDPFGDSGTVGSTSVRRALNKAQRLEHVKAVVLRVDSPGGSALASEIMWHATQKLTAEKPLIVSMGNVAASGGYYVSAGAQTIFAEPGTITGSIGVIGGKLVTRGFWNWAGITFDVTQRGKNAGLFTSLRPWEEREREVVKDYLEDIYAEFTDRVRQGRGDHLAKEIDELAGGRVYTGRQALDLGLVDQLGGLHDAIEAAAEAAELEDYELILLPTPQSFVEVLVQSLTGEQPGSDEVELKLSAAQLNGPGLVEQLLPMVERLDPERAGVVLESLQRIQLLHRERALAIMPCVLRIR